MLKILQCLKISFVKFLLLLGINIEWKDYQWSIFFFRFLLDFIFRNFYNEYITFVNRKNVTKID